MEPTSPENPPTPAAQNGTNGQPAPAPESAELARLQSELASRDKKLDEVLRAFATAKNEQAEFRTRLQRERDRLIDLERGKVATVLMETADELDMALKASTQDSSPLAQGLRFVRDSLTRRMTEFGLEAIPMLGKPFDPNVAEAADTSPVQDPKQEGLVLNELKRAYTFAGKLLRPGRVLVGKYAADGATAPKPE